MANLKRTVTKGDVLDDLGFTQEQTLVVKVKFDIFNKIIEVIETRKLSPRELELILDQPQPRISELLNGKISGVSIEKLLEYLERLVGEVIVSIKVRKVA